MNFEDNNQKQIDKLSRMEKVYQDSEKHESVMDKIEAEEEEDICAFPRKIAKWLMILMWVFCLVGVAAGVEFTILVCGMLFTLGLFCGLNVTKFLKKEKLADAVISALVAAACLALAVLLLVNDMH